MSTNRLKNACKLVLFLCPFPLFANTMHNGDTLHLSQPDHSAISVRLFGEYPAIYGESVDGYTLVKDNASDWYCYAVIKDGGLGLSPSEHYVQGGQPSFPLSKHLRRSAAVDEKRIADFAAANPAPQINALYKTKGITTGVYTRRSGTINGCALLIDFPDRPSTIPVSEIQNFLTRQNYAGGGNNGSVRDFYFDCSSGRMNFVPTATVQYFRAPKAFTYYNTSDATATELIKATLQYFDTTVDFSKFDNNHAGHTDGMNIFYAGNGPNFGDPLWPHSGSYGGTEKYDGVTITNYEMTDIGTQLGLYVFCHENGHMLFGFPDCYGCGDMVGLMGSRPNDQNPIPDCEVFTEDQGWTDVVDFDNTSTGTFRAIKNPFYAFRYKNPNKANEYYMWVNRKNEGRWSVLTGKGVEAFHFDASVRTNAPPKLPLCLQALEADGLPQLDSTNWPIPGSKPADFFYSTNNAALTPTSNPNTNWNNNTASGLSITNISAISDTMTFTIGAAGAGTQKTLYVVRGQGSGSFTSGQSAPIVAGAAPAGKVFKCWRSEGSLVSDLMSPATNITIPAAWNPVVVAAYRDTELPVIDTCIMWKTPFAEFRVHDAYFYDDGGPSVNYSANFGGVTTFYPLTPGNKLLMTFSSFAIVGTGTDALTIYNGNNAGLTPVGSYSGNAAPPAVASSAPDGSITVMFHSDSAAQAAGWTAHIVEQASSATVFRQSRADRAFSVGMTGSRMTVRFAALDNQPSKMRRCVIAVFRVDGKKIKTVYDGSVGAADPEIVIDLDRVFSAPLAHGMFLLKANIDGTELAAPFLMAR
ncbi:MAG: M6 family metalloprotease domain-containing protein [Chitinivibrionales bacterium]